MKPVVYASIGLLTIGVTLGIGSAAQAEFTPINLNSWTAESYILTGSAEEADWYIADDGGQTVTQLYNSQPTLFYSNFDVFNTEFEGKLEVALDAGDDDSIGFALGFQPGDTTNPDADYILIDWRKRDQSEGYAGLAVSEVFGVPTGTEFWNHSNVNTSSSDLNNGLEELARGITLGDTGWVAGQSYMFRVEYSATSLKVYVDDVLQIDLTADDFGGSFPNGRLAFYNYSQPQVTYSTCVVTVANVAIDIKPGGYPNCFNNSGHGAIPVAILGSETFDVSRIDVDSISMEGLKVKTVGKRKKALAHIEDVNYDGFDDLVVQFQDEDGYFPAGTGEATVIGLLDDGRNFQGTDSICVTQ